MISLVGILIISAVAQTNQQAKKQPSESMNSERLADFASFKSIRYALWKTIHGNESQPITSANSTVPTDTQPTKDDFLKLYQVLKNLQTTKQSYLESMKLYISARKKHGVDSMEAGIEEDHFQKELQTLNKNLEDLKTAFAKVQIPLDFNPLKTGEIVERYYGARTAKAKKASRLKTLSTAEWDSLYQSALQNNNILDNAISSLFTFIQQKYPEIGKS